MGAPLSGVNRHPFTALSDSHGMNIGLRLRHARKLRGLTQVELAKKAAVTQASISDLERGKSRSFRGVTLIAVARVLNVGTEWLQTGKGSMEKQDIHLSDDALVVAQAWQRLTPEVRAKVADMIFMMVEQSDKYGPTVEDAKVAAAYGKPGAKK